MPTYIAFVRGINVGGKVLRMADLTAICEDLGFESVRTFLQSGNVIFRSRKAAATLEKELEEAIRTTKKMGVRVMVRDRDALARAIDANPFPDQCRRDPGHTIIIFLDQEPTIDAKAKLRDAYAGPEPMHFNGRELYVFYGDGMGKSKLTPALYERKLGVSGTARNWNTVTKLAELTRP